MTILSLLAQPDGAQFGSPGFWSFLATVAFILQLILQRYYANQAAAQAKEVAEAAERKTQQLAVKAAAAAVKVEEVKQTLQVVTATTAAQLDQIKDTGDKIHALVNNNMSIALKSNAALARRVADLTGLAADSEVADLAESRSKEHDEKQTHLDRG